MSRRHDNAPLGNTQLLVLRLLANHEHAPTVEDLAHDWPGLTESAVGSALRRLGRRSLVDVAGITAFRGNARTYKLTEKGRALELAALDEAAL